MPDSIYFLTATAATLGFFHTLLGPDHYLPFLAMGRAEGWSRAKTLAVTALCGLGHVFSSVLIGAIGIAFGVAIFRLEMLESVRGELSAWVLIAAGAVYTAWGFRKALKNRFHLHQHVHPDGTLHTHPHATHTEHRHDDLSNGKSQITPWILFAVFVLGPCKTLIPILMVPAAQNSLIVVVWVTAVFGAVTLLTMLGIVFLATFGLQRLPLLRMERYGHALAGGTLCLCGIGIITLGL